MDIRPLRKKIAFFLVAGFYLLAAGARAETKNYYFPQVRIKIQIASDGTFAVDEFRTYDFRGRFSWASLWIPLRADRQGYRFDVSVEDFSVADENGQLLRTEAGATGDRFEAKWFYDARSEKRTFHIHYRVRGGILSYPQVSELYWQAIGSGWDKPTREAEVMIHLPEPVPSKDDILVYGHGPLSGVAEIIDSQTARFRATNIGSRQFLEIRMAWPAGLVKGVPSDGRTWESIRGEEARFVQETIARVKAAREARDRRVRALKKLAGLWLAWTLLAPLLWLYFYMGAWRRVGKDYSFPDIPDYMHEPPSKLQPALVENLLKEGTGISPRSFTATIFDLARRGYIDIEDRLVEKRGILGSKHDYETTLTLRKDYREERSFYAHERDLLDLLFEDVADPSLGRGARLTLDDLKKYFKKHPQRFQKWFQEWRKTVKQEAKDLRFIEPPSLRMRNIFIAVTVPLAVLTLSPLLGIVGIALIPKLKRRAMAWARENELWNALKRFLDDFSSFKDIPPEAYKLWDQYLVFGILFGNAKKIIKTLPVLLADERAVVPVWYSGFSRTGFLNAAAIDHVIGRIEAMSTSIEHASTAAAHYSSGGGGGFSGGGGGGSAG